MARKFENIRDVVASMPKSFRPDKAEGVESVIQIHYTGDDGGDWWLDIKNQTVVLNEGTHESPELTMTCSSEDWLKLVNREANPMAMIMQRKLQFSGSMPMAMKFAGMFGLA
ncbi:MAG: SCP2 sterol-binding domain-containing protein [Bacteroidetes Order II. Incertae sedis bacterium]|nr:SCP2 sterol-binding domain-containing protein [Bacteroidetes Order II. bacterium]